MRGGARCTGEGASGLKVRNLVESRRGAVAVGSGNSGWPAAFAWVPVPQSDPWLRFHVPLIEPDVRISRIRLSDKVSCVRTRVAARKQGKSHQAETLGQVPVGVS